MRFQKAVMEPPKVGLTSLIDIVFLLLIFFMVSTTFDRQGDIQIKLPEAAAFVETEDDALDLIVDANGRFWVNGIRVGEPQKANLQQYLSDNQQLKSKPVRLRADGDASHQSVVTVLDLLASGGFSKVAIATIQGEPAP